jgi:hypothetical protein
MSYATAPDLSYVPPQEFGPAHDDSPGTVGPTLAESSGWYLKRSAWLPLPFLLPVALCGISWFGGGIQFLTDLGFGALAILCTTFLVVELIRFPQRFGIGGFVLFGGVLVWFCHDYFYRWFNYDGHGVYPQWVIAKTAFLVSAITMSMVVGLNIRAGKWLERVVSLVPEAGSGGFYLCLLLVLFGLGVLPYFLFVREPFWEAIYHDMVGMRSSTRAAWTIGRTGNYNTSWAAYAFHLLDIGYFSGMFGAFYSTTVARGAAGKLTGWLVWLFWTLMAFGSGTRGYVIVVVVPAMGFLYIKYHLEAARLLRRTSVKAYVVTISLTLVMLVLVQFQGMFRNARAEQRQWTELDIKTPRGNHMFSEGLLAAQTVPSETPYFANGFIGEGPIRVIPDLIVTCALHPIPRALWPDKPRDAAWEWYNRRFTGERANPFNTTIAPGIAVGQYMRYGVGGMCVFGVIFGWLMSCTERVLRGAGGRPVQVLTSLALAVWLFRCFRGGLGWMEFYALVIGLAVLSLFVILGKPLIARD